MHLNITVAGGQIIGEPQYRVNNDGVRYFGCTISSRSRWARDKKEDTRIFIRAFGDLGEAMAKNFRGGDYLCVLGYLSSYMKIIEDKNGNMRRILSTHVVALKYDGETRKYSRHKPRPEDEKKEKEPW